MMAVTAAGKELEKRDTRYLALSCRIASELGARVVKTSYCEDFDKLTESSRCRWRSPAARQRTRPPRGSLICSRRDR